MEPIVFIHGYSAESRGTATADIVRIYGALPDELRRRFPGGVEEIDLSRYVSLDDGVDVDDISRALQRALETDFEHLLVTGFNAIVHSTGALVLRNWVRRFSAQPSPLRRLIYLAGANFGSGWAHIGRGQAAKWGRLVFDHGSERGVQVLNALELGADWTIDLHLALLRDGTSLWRDYRVNEAVLIGSQAHVRWFEAPIRYAKEDGSDGVVRVAASNVNFHYLRFGPTAQALDLPWDEVSAQTQNLLARSGERGEFYELKEGSRPDDDGRPAIPFAIPYECAHSGDETGIVIGAAPRDQVLRLVIETLLRPPAQWPDLVELYRKETEETYAKVAEYQAPPWWKKWLTEPRAQYDHHAQVIFRIRDQNGRPVEHYDIFFDSLRGADDQSDPIGRLFEDKHINSKSPHIICFYLRTDAFSRNTNRYEPRLPGVDGCYLEVSATQPGTDLVVYLPMRFQFDAKALESWIVGHRTTIIDVELFRVPAPDVYRIVRLP